MSDEKIKVRDVRNGDWYWVSKVLLDEYGDKLKPIGIAIYNCLAAHANQEGFCFPSHGYIAKKIGASISSVQRGMRQLIKLQIIRKSRRRYHNMYYLLKIDRSYRPNSKEIGQSDRHIGQSDRSDRSAGTTNKNKEKDLIKKNYSRTEKTGDNLRELKSQLIEKMSMHGAKRTAMDDTQLALTVREVVEPRTLMALLIKQYTRGFLKLGPDEVSLGSRHCQPVNIELQGLAQENLNEIKPVWTKRN